MSSYLDTSALVPLFVPDGHSAMISAWFHQAPAPPRVSDFAGAEFSSAIGRLLRIGELSRRKAEDALGRFDDWRRRAVLARLTMTSDITSCERLVRDFRLKLSAPDALHLAIARADKLPLVTFDLRLAAAARSLRHPVVVPGA